MSEFTHLENALRTLGKPGAFSRVEKQAIRDQLFMKIGFHSLTPHPSPLTPRLAWLTAVPVAIFALFLSLATGVVAQQAIPGDTLFVLKRAVENLQLFMTRDPLRIASVRLQIADDRMRGLAAANTPRELSRVLDSTQATLADANKAVSALPKDMAENLVTRFEGLLEQQNTLLDRLSKTATSEEIKTKIVAIREEIKRETESKKPETGGEQGIATTAPMGPTAPATTSSALAIGPVSLDSRLVTSGGKVAIAFGSQAYLLDTTLNLYGYVGSLVSLRGVFDGAVIQVNYLATGSGQVLIGPNLSAQ